MTDFFTADTHFVHEKIFKMGRDEFATGEEHDEHILDQLNTTVGRDDRLFILGDFAFRKASKWKGLIRCKRIRFVIGNHDRYQDSLLAFGTVEEILVLRQFNGNQKAVLCHYPMAYWPGSHHGDYHFYGHMHAQREDTINTASMFAGRRSLDVGVDNAKKLLGRWSPFSKAELLEILHDAPGHDQVSFYRALSGEEVGI